MRLALLVLVVANLAVFAWLRWAQAPVRGPDLVPSGRSGKPELRLVNSPPASSATAADARPAASSASASPARGSSASPVSAAAPARTSAASVPAFEGAGGRTPSADAGCLVWPVASSSAGRALAARLKAAGYRTRVVARGNKRPGDYRVFLSGFAGLAAARKAEASLRRRGIRDFYVMPATPSRGPLLSLGIFGDRAHAERLARRLRALGFEPGIRARSRLRHYVETRMAAAASVPSALRAAGVTGKPRRAGCIGSPATRSEGAPAARSAS